MTSALASTTKPRVLVLGERTAENASVVKLAAVADITWLPYVEDYDEALQQAIEREGPFVAFGATFILGKPFPPIGREVYLKPLFPALKFVCTPGAGYDKVELDYLTRQGCLFANSPTSVGVRTADGALMLLLAAMRGLTPLDLHARAGKWRNLSVRTINWREATLGIVGLGSIGAMIAASAAALGFKRIVYSNRRARDVPYEHVPLEVLLSDSDAVVLCCPLTPETHHLIDREALSSMKPGSVLVNVSRGAVVDEQALVDALESGPLVRAALDVFENEPDIHPKLLSNPNVTLSPHSAAAPDGMGPGMNAEVLDNIVSYLQTGQALTPINQANLDKAGN